MKKVLIVVDMQVDFINGSLGTKEAEGIVDKVVSKIKTFDGDILFTLDTHSDNYLESKEGKNLPIVHCIKGSDGWQLNDLVCVALLERQAHGSSVNTEVFTKPTFGSVDLAKYISDNKYKYIEFVGLCTDICVISNVLLTKAYLPEAEIVVDANCCAGVTPESHKNALNAMKMCQVEVINDEA